MKQSRMTRRQAWATLSTFFAMSAPLSLAALVWNAPHAQAQSTSARSGNSPRTITWE